MTKPNEGFFLKSFLIDSTVNANESAILPDYIDKHIRKFIGRPLILTDHLTHPREFYQLHEGPNHEENIGMYLELQKKYEIGRIMDVQKSTKGSKNEYEAIIEVTNPHAIRLLKSGKLPRCVSPSIYRLNITDYPSAITDYEPINLTIVDSPAYGFQVANVRSICEGTSSACLRTLLHSASIKTTIGLQDLKGLEKGVDRLQANITKLQKRVDDLLAWKELKEFRSNRQKYLNRLSEIDMLLEFAGGS